MIQSLLQAPCLHSNAHPVSQQSTSGGNDQGGTLQRVVQRQERRLSSLEGEAVRRPCAGEQH